MVSIVSGIVFALGGIAIWFVFLWIFGGFAVLF